MPAGAVFVATTGDDGTGDGSQAAPFQTLSRALQSTPSGGTVVMRGGTYHATTIAGHSVNATVQPYPGEAVWFDGSVPVTGWTQNGNVWVHNGWTATFDHSASYTSGSEYVKLRVAANHVGIPVHSRPPSGAPQWPLWPLKTDTKVISLFLCQRKRASASQPFNRRLDCPC